MRLRDGSAVLIRPVRPEDAGLLEDGFAGLSDRSRRLRFLGPKASLSAAELRSRRRAPTLARPTARRRASAFTAAADTAAMTGLRTWGRLVAGWTSTVTARVARRAGAPGRSGGELS